MKIEKIFKENWFSLVLIILLVAAFSYILKNSKENERLHKELVGKEEKYQQLNQHVAKLESKYKKQKELKKELEKNWAEEKSHLKGRLKLLSNATYLIREKARREDNSDVEYRGDKVKYVFNEIKFNDGPPIGYVLIFDNGRVTSKIYDHVIDVKLAVSRDEESGKYSVLSKANYILKSPHFQKENAKNWFNKPYPLDIIGGKAIIDPTEPNRNKKEFHLLAPSLNAGINLGPDIKPSIGVSLAGYGRSESNLDWKFLQIGLDYSKENYLGLNLIPVLYRPFPKILKNTYLGPGLGYDKRGYNLFLNLNVGF